VQIASYRDDKLIDTIEGLLDNAKNPDIFNFGICWQYDETEDITKYDKRDNFRIKKYHYSESGGLGWARAITNTLLENEELTLQIDSHHKFKKHWDVMMLEDFNQAKQFSKKPILTTYLTPFDYSSENLEDVPCLMSQYEFSSDKLLMSMPYYISDYKERDKVIRCRTISGHFFLADSNFIKEVPYDPDIYFGGYVEETTLSVRAYTHGYDLFSPYRQYIWHEYSRNGRPKHWEDHGTEISPGYLKTKKTSLQRDILARDKTRQLFGQEDHGMDLGKYGLGTVRTLHDYEVYGGFNFKKCLIQDYTLKVKEPPNPTNYEEQFIAVRYDIDLQWDKEFFIKQNIKNPKVLTMGVLNNSDLEIYRKDFIEKDLDYLNFNITNYRATFQAFDKPAKIVMYMMGEDNKWSDRYEKAL
jgi:hypothetical protein